SSGSPRFGHGPAAAAANQSRSLRRSPAPSAARGRDDCRWTLVSGLRKAPACHVRRLRESVAERRTGGVPPPAARSLLPCIGCGQRATDATDRPAIVVTAPP